MTSNSNYPSTPPPFITKSQQTQIRKYFASTPSQKQQLCTLCGFRIKIVIGGQDIIQKLTDHFFKVHPQEWENIKVQVQESYAYDDMEESPYANLYDTGNMEASNNMQQSSRNYQTYYQNYNPNQNTYQNYQTPNTPYYQQPYQPTQNSQAWQSEYGYQWNNTEIQEESHQYQQELYGNNIGVDYEESNRNYNQYSNFSSRQTPGNVYGNYDRYDDGYGYYGGDSVVENQGRRYGMYQDSVDDGYTSSNAPSLFKYQNKVKASNSKDKFVDSNKYKNTGLASKIYEQPTLTNKNSNLSQSQKTPRQPQPSNQLSNTESQLQSQSQPQPPKQKQKPQKPQNILLNQDDKNITYQNLIGIKNRPTKFVNKINQQYYFFKPQFLPHISTSSLTLQLFSMKHMKQPQAYREFFKAVDLALNRQAVIAMAKSKLSVSEEDAMRMVDLYWWGGKDLDQIGIMLCKRGINYRQSPAKNTILITQRDILSQYIKHGQCIYIVSYNQLVKMNRTDSSSQVPYNTYIFLLADSRAEFIFVSVGLTRSNRSENLCQMLEMFYGSVHGFIGNGIVVNFVHGQGGSKQGEYQMRRAVKMFENKYLSSWSIGLSFNYNSYFNNLSEEVIQLKSKQQQNKKISTQIDQQFQKFQQQLTNLITTHNQNAQTSPQITKLLQKTRIRIKTTQPLTQHFHKHDPKSIGQLNNNTFVGIINKRKQIESLYRKMNLIVKPFQCKTLSFVELVSNVWKLSRYLKKIGKQIQLDFRFDYRSYAHPSMYKLHKKLGPKIFNILQQNYQTALKLTLTHISLTTIKIHQPSTPTPTASLQTPTKTITYTLNFLLDSNYWVCNCGKIQETGIPCRHLIAVVLFYGGEIQFYVDQRWVLTKGEKQKLRKFRQKQVADQE